MTPGGRGGGGHGLIGVASERQDKQEIITPGELN